MFIELIGRFGPFFLNINTIFKVSVSTENAEHTFIQTVEPKVYAIVHEPVATVMERIKSCEASLCPASTESESA